MTDRATIDDFLAQTDLAFIGASRDPKAFSSSVYRELRQHGHTLYPVNPNADLVEGDECYRSVAALPAVAGAIVMVASERSADAVQECIDAGIPRIWLHKGVGRSSVSDEAVALCTKHGVAVVDGACPLMFAEPVAGVHRIHRFERKVTGRLPS